MNWNQLILQKRFNTSSVTKDKTDGRSVFDNDYSRMTLSPHIRRLQNKAQVFPLEKTDFTRNRLTHSLEVSSFAKGLGLGIERLLIEEKKLDSNREGFIPSILQTSGLIHDIGNPPFGHFGEETIQRFFSKYFSENNEKYSNFSEAENRDFLKFDGNVQGFRILRKLGLADNEFGYNITLPTLASIIKYPVSSEKGYKDDENQISKKKFGYFQSEKEDFEIINDKLGLGGKRHPLVFILEVADDVAYSVCDIEDGFRKSIITKEFLIDELEILLKDTENENFINELKEINRNTRKDHPARDEVIFQKFRIKVQSFMLIEGTKAFIKYHDDILNGTFDKDLLISSKASSLRKAFKKLSYNNFQHRSVLKRELIGEQVISFLMEQLINAITNKEKLSKPKSKESKLNALISPSYKFVNDVLKTYPNEEYNKLQLVTDYVSGMTDTFALDLFRELMGHKME